MAKKRGSFLGKLFGAAVVAGAAATVSKLEKQAKEEGKDILDVAKEKVDSFVEDVKSGEALEKAKDFANKAQDFAEKTVNEVNSGEFSENLKGKINETVESVKSGEFADKAKEVATNVRDGVVDLLDGKEGENTIADAVDNVVEKVEDIVEDIKNNDQM